MWSNAARACDLKVLILIMIHVDDVINNLSSDTSANCWRLTYTILPSLKIIAFCFTMAWCLIKPKHRYTKHWRSFDGKYPTPTGKKVNQEFLTSNGDNVISFPSITVRPEQNGRHFVDDISNPFSWRKIYIWSEISLKYVLCDKLILVEALAWCRTGKRSLIEPKMRMFGGKATMSS